ncbi:hypothetical protein [Breoghania sp.]|uniref:hypothetical protein n=1 Tax=Breoghania sp. TaxID=2065378 RepID=UPI0026281D40|nr:hypothetical protein [Breoghania sp.]MDJ0933328.1 hypothetical protein [Breoghania sp.]
MRLPNGSVGGRNLTGGQALLTIVLCLVFSVFVLAINSVLLMDQMHRSGVFVALLLAILFLLFPATPKSPRDRFTTIDFILAIAGAAIGLYIYFRYETFTGGAFTISTTDYVFAIGAILLALEAGRRSIGIWMSLLSIVFFAYALFGEYVPGPFGHFPIA